LFRYHDLVASLAFQLEIQLAAFRVVSLLHCGQMKNGMGGFLLVQLGMAVSSGSRGRRSSPSLAFDDRRRRFEEVLSGGAALWRRFLNAQPLGTLRTNSNRRPTCLQGPEAACPGSFSERRLGRRGILICIFLSVSVVERSLSRRRRTAVPVKGSTSSPKLSIQSKVEFLDRSGQKVAFWYFSPIANDIIYVMNLVR
jgi:hypothetical protein